MWETLKRQLRKYLDLSHWMLRDSLAMFGKRLVGVQAERFLAVGMQLATFGVLASYAQHLEQDAPVQLLAWQFDPRASIVLLVLVAAGAVAGLVAAALLAYHSHTMLLKVVRAYEEHCIRRVVERFTSPYAPAPDAFAPEPSPRPNTLVNSDPRKCARVIYRVNDAVVPSCLVGVTTLPILFYLQPVLSLLVMLLAGASLFFHYRNSIRSATLSRENEESSPGKSRVLRQLLRRANHQTLPLHPRLVDEALNEQPVRRNARSYYGRLNTVQRSRMFSELMTGLIIGAILVILGGRILLSGVGWGTLIIYLLALRLSMNHLGALMRAMTTINRFYYQVRRYFVFLQATDPALDAPASDGDGHAPAPAPAEARSPAPATARPATDATGSAATAATATALPAATAIAPHPATALTVQRRASPALPGSRDEHTPAAGECLALLAAEPLDRMTLPSILDRLAPHTPRALRAAVRHTAVLGDTPELPVGYTWREALGIGENRSVDDLPACRGDEALTAWVRAELPDDLDQSIVAEASDELASRVAWVQAGLIVASRPFSAILASARRFASLPPAQRDMLRKLWADRVLWLIADSTQAIDLPDVATVVALSPDGVVGIGDTAWADAHRPALDAALAAWARQTGIGETAGWNDDDEDDE